MTESVKVNLTEVKEAVASLGDALTNFANASWAQNIKDNVFKLLSIAEEGASVLGKSALI